MAVRGRVRQERPQAPSARLPASFGVEYRVGGCANRTIHEIEVAFELLRGMAAWGADWTPFCAGLASPRNSRIHVAYPLHGPPPNRTLSRLPAPRVERAAVVREPVVFGLLSGSLLRGVSPL
jgi:hypothetical protein